MTTRLISVVIPLFNETSNLLTLYARISLIAEQIKESYLFEIIFVDDGSRDESWITILSLSYHDVRIKGISFSRNFGKEIAITAGYDYARGDAIITMDSDLQHPPEFIPELIKAWENGYDIVYTRNKQHYENIVKKYTAFLHYKILDAISTVRIPSYVQDFRLIDKKVLKILCQSREKARYLRGMVAWTGFSHTCLDVVYEKRFKGNSTFSLTQLFRVSFDGLTGFSLFPLRIAAYVGAFVITTGLAMFGYLSLRSLFFVTSDYWLFKCLISIIYIFMGVLFILVWLLGEYIGRIYEEIKGRPLYVVAARCNVDESYRDEAANAIHRREIGQEKNI
jgi:dolichol-phosphate mannosyltransferase